MAQGKGRAKPDLRKALTELSQEQLQELLSPKYRVISSDEWDTVVSSLQIGVLSSACARGVLDSQTPSELDKILEGIRSGLAVLEDRRRSLG